MSDSDWDIVDDVEIDFEDADESKVESSRVVDQAGSYHLEITNVKVRFELDDKNNNKNMLCTCRVLHSAPNQCAEGSIYYHEIMFSGKGGSPPEGWMKDSMLSFLYGVGIMKKEGKKYIDPETGTPKLNWKTLPERLKNLQFVGDIKREPSKDDKYDDRFRLKFGKGAFPVTAPEVSNVPKHGESLELLGLSRSEAEKIGGVFEKKNGSTAPAEKPAEPVATPATNGQDTANATTKEFDAGGDDW